MSESKPELLIFHVEDNPQDALLVELTLRKEGLTFRVERLETEEEFVRALRGPCPDLILSDFSMPRFSGSAALSRARVNCPEVPFIFVSGHIGEDRAIESLKNGATDYVLKDRLSRLGPVVRRALSEAEEREKRRNAEASLSRSRAETDLILENAADAVITISAEDLVTGWNLQAERTFGWSPEEVLGRPLGEFLLPSADRVATLTGLDRPIQFRARHKDGFDLPVEMTVVPIRAPGRTFFAAFLKDLREVQREAAGLALDYSVTKILAESPTLDAAIPGLLRAMTECLSWGLAQYWKVDAEAEVLRATSSWPPLEERDSEFVRASRSIAFKKGAGLPGEVWRAGEGIWAPDVASGDADPRAGFAGREGFRGAFGFPVVDGPEVLGVVECFHPETQPPDRELLEIATAVGRSVGRLNRREGDPRGESRLTEALACRVEERTRELREVADELEGFAYSVAHDLRAPLRALVGFSDILIREWTTLPGPDVETYLDRIRGAARSMDTLVEDLLGYNRLSREQIVVAPVDLDWEVGEVLHRMGPEIRERRGEVQIERPLPPALAHPRTFRLVLVHLLSNALKFVAPGVAPRIRIAAEDRGDRIRLSVVDNGIGIPADQRERIFKVFERLHPENEFPGTGIGLAIVRRGIERMGGSSGVESSPGKGSTFWIELAKEAAPPDPSGGED